MQFYVYFVYILSYDNIIIIDYLYVFVYLLFFNILIFDLWILMFEYFRWYFFGFIISQLYKVLFVFCYFFMIKNYFFFFCENLNYFK